MQLHQYWHAAPPPADVAAAMAAVRAMNPALEARVHDRASAAAMIAARLGARHAAAFARCAVPAMQADYARYCAVFLDGGVYLDADHGCRVPLATLLPPDAGGVLFHRPSDTVVNGCFALRDAGHPLAAAALEVATRGIEQRLSENVWITTGPAIFTFLWLLARMTEAERADLDFDHVDPDASASIRLCDAVTAGGAAALFEGVAVRPFEVLDAACPHLPMDYKSGSTHWLAWQGSIFA